MTRLLIAALLALTLAACASAPKSIPALEQARADVQAAQADSDAQRYANREIEEASRLLASAESAAKDRKDLSTIGHLAYLSSQTAKIARETGKTKAAEQRIAQGASERERIRLEARTREAQAARSAAEQARMEAQQARSAATQAGTQLAVAQERSAQLEKEMEELMAKRSERGLVVTLGDVLFDTGQAELKTGADRQLNMVAAFLAERPERRILIEGFTDSVGSDEYNQQLSQRRADAVRNALVSRGVDPSRIDIQGYGEQYPVGTNADAGGRQLNRRVEVIVSTGSDPVAPRTRL